MTRLPQRLLGVLFLAVPAFAAAPPVPPTITTTAATNITQTSATLNATLVPNSLVPTSVIFSYGLGPATVNFYSSYVPVSTGAFLAGTFPYYPAHDIGGLSCNTNYHFSIVAYYPGGAAQGSELQFTTVACVKVATLPASGITAGGGTIIGAANGANMLPGTSPSTPQPFDYGATTTYGNTAANLTLGILGVGTFSANLTGLGCSTLVHYRANAQALADGSIIHGGDATFSTTPCPGAPTATTVLGSAITATGATLNGLVGDTGAASAAAVTFEYGATNGYGNTVTATPASIAAGNGSTAVSLALTGLACNTLYHFRVDATNGAFTTYGADRAVDTAPCAATLDDTGVDYCFDNGSLAPCTAANSGDAATYPRQDGRFGRDPAADTGYLIKTGTGDKGFDYTLVCNTAGDIAGQNDCPAIVTGRAGTGNFPQNQWSCTRDNATNLVWEASEGILGSLHTDPQGNLVSGAPYSFLQNVIDRLNSRSICGFSSGWRLPTLKEMNSLMHSDRQLPAYDTDYFYYLSAYPRGTSFWTSDLYAADPTQVNTISLDDGSGGQDSVAAGLHDAFFVHSSSGNGPTPPAFTDNGDGTVSDANTLLMWDQCTWGLSGANPGSKCAVGSALGEFWPQALATAVTANAMNGGTGYKGHNDWRMPNKNELMSITDPRYDPAIDPVIFPHTGEANYWTSTLYVGAGSAWTVYFPLGGPFNNGFFQIQPFPPFVPPYLRLVRGGRPIDTFDVLVPYRITYNGNGNTSGSAPIDGTAYGTGSPVTVLGNTGGLLKTGYSFVNWNTKADGSGAAFFPGDTFTFGARNVTLYAQYTLGFRLTHNVSYNGNANTSGSAPTDAATYAVGATVTVLDSGSLAKAGSFFGGWNTRADGTGTSYASGATFSMAAFDVNLFAQWLSGINSVALQPGVCVAFPVTLASPAGPNGVYLTLTVSDSTKVTFENNLSPLIIFIPAGSTTPGRRGPQLCGVNFGTATVTISGGVVTQGQVVGAAVGATLSWSPATVTMTTSAQLRLTLFLSTPAPASGVTVNLSSDNPGVATVPSTVTIPANSQSASVTVTGVSAGTTLIHASALPNVPDTIASVTVH